MKLITILFLMLLCSCANIKSGKYVMLKKNETLEDVAKEFNVPVWEIRSANKNKRFSVGELIYIPLNIGIVSLYTEGPAGNSKGYLSYKEFVWPVPSSKKISSKFGRRWGKAHLGIDIPARRGSNIIATNSGVVIYSGNGYSGFGNLTIIAHPYGLFSIYAHSKVNYTKVGQRVHRGQVIALVGNTGRSTGPHLHFEIRKNGSAINPVSIVSKN